MKNYAGITQGRKTEIVSGLAIVAMAIIASSGKTFISRDIASRATLIVSVMNTLIGWFAGFVD
jgi:hypothetical protein